MARVKPVGHEDRLSVVDHLDELRSRIFVAVAAFLVAFGLCLWQNHQILDLLNEPLPQRYENPVTLSPAEPFLTTLTVSAYAAILIALPVILFEVYAFVLPAFTPRERKVALPLLLMVPVLFAGGVVFSYFVVLPAAVNFLLNFNEDQFETQLRAREYYGFAAMTLLALGVLFQIPVGILAAARLGLTSAARLRRNRRIAVVLIAVVAALLPGQDPVTMLIMMVPLLALFELSILLAALFGTARDAAEPEPEASPEGSSG